MLPPPFTSGALASRLSTVFLREQVLPTRRRQRPPDKRLEAGKIRYTADLPLDFRRSWPESYLADPDQQGLSLTDSIVRTTPAAASRHGDHFPASVMDSITFRPPFYP